MNTDVSRGLAEAKLNQLPWVGLYWDIENCPVPATRIASQVVKFLRQRFLADCREAEFVVVCDVEKENRKNRATVEELNLENLTVVHVSSAMKNAADDKLRTLMGRFARLHGPGDVMILISGDINFSPELQRARHERKLDVIIIHPPYINAAILSSATENYIYGDLLAEVPNGSIHTLRPPGIEETDLMVRVARFNHRPRMRNRLEQVASPDGGNVAWYSAELCEATVKFPCLDKTRRGRVRLDGADAFGFRLRAEYIPGSILHKEELISNGQSDRTALPATPSSKQLVASSNPDAPTSSHVPRDGLNDMTQADTITTVERIPSFDAKKDRTSLYFINLDASVDQLTLYRDLVLRLEMFVPVELLSLYNDSEPAYAHVVLLQPESASVLIEQFDGQEFCGRQLAVTREDPCRRSDAKESSRELPSVSHADSNKQDCVFGISGEYCTIHCPDGSSNQSLLEKPYNPLGLYRAPLQNLSADVTAMLARHGGSLPLASFMVCFEEEVGELVEDLDEGCYLEHLLLSVPGVSIGRLSTNGSRMLIANEELDDKFQLDNNRLIPSGMSEAVLETMFLQPRAAVILSEFATVLFRNSRGVHDLRHLPQSELIEIVTALKYLQVIGVGADRVVTLTYEAQLKRFADELKEINDLLGASVTADNIENCYEATFDRKFWIGNYGVSSLRDLFGIAEMWDDGALSPSLPESECSAVTKHPPHSLVRLAAETAHLLTTTSQYRLEFSQFANTFTLFFSRRIRLKDFGKFDSLTDLLKAKTMREVVEIETTAGGDSFVVLRREKRLAHLGEVLKEVARLSEGEMSPLDFKLAFRKSTGIEFKESNYGASVEGELFRQFPNTVQVMTTGKKLMLYFNRFGSA